MELYGLHVVGHLGAIFLNVMVHGKLSIADSENGSMMVSDNIFRILSLEAELEELSIDASIIQAHQHSAGAKKGDLQMKSGIAVEEPAPKSMRQ